MLKSLSNKIIIFRADSFRKIFQKVNLKKILNNIRTRFLTNKSYDGFEIVNTKKIIVNLMLLNAIKFLA